MSVSAVSGDKCRRSRGRDHRRRWDTNGVRSGPGTLSPIRRDSAGWSRAARSWGRLGTARGTSTPGRTRPCLTSPYERRTTVYRVIFDSSDSIGRWLTRTILSTITYGRVKKSLCTPTPPPSSNFSYFSLSPPPPFSSRTRLHRKAERILNIQTIKSLSKMMGRKAL